MSNTELVKSQTDEVDRANPLETTLTGIQLAMDPGVDVEKLDRLILIQRELIAERSKRDFMAGLSEIMPALPSIAKTGAIILKDGTKQPFARYEDIDRVVRPLLARHGFALRFTTDPIEGGKIRVVMYVSHIGGHIEKSSVDLPVDQTGSKNATQAVGSTLSYGKRYLVTMFFNIITEGQDDDGNGGSDPITEQQADDLRRLIADAAAAKRKREEDVLARLLKFMGADTLNQVLAKDYKRAVGALAQMKEGGK